ncbi:MAG TPA: hypothetical protein VF585_04645 [Chthoniobacterales bacterium]|jgi:hypothetical protein
MTAAPTSAAGAIPNAQALPSSRRGTNDPQRWLRLAIYAYFLLWIFEGSLRKWILPGLSGPLLIIRDPVLVFIYFEAFRLRLFKLNGYVTFLTFLSVLAVVIGFGLPEAPNWKIIVFGYRANFMHLPLIFLLPQIFNYTDVRKIGRIIITLAPFMAVLAAAQFLSPPGARLNTGAGGEGGMIETALGRIRPSGTFSFTNGLAGYTVVLAAFLFHHLLEKKIFGKLSILLAAGSLLVLVLMSGSRTVFALVGLEVATMIAIWMIKPRFLRSSIKIVAIGVAVGLLVGSVGALQMGLDVIVTRFTTSGGVKEGFLIRFLDEFKKPIDAASIAEPAGVGIGMGTNVASSMMYNMLRFNFGESEMDRIIMEMGPYMGFPYLFWRFAVVFLLFRTGLAALRVHNNTLPLFLATACANDVVMGQFGQSTVVGFAVFFAGLTLAATSRRPDEGLTSYEGFEPGADARLRAEQLQLAATAETPTLRVAPRISSYADRLRAEAEAEMDQSLQATETPDLLTGQSTPPSPTPAPKKARRPRTKKVVEALDSPLLPLEGETFEPLPQSEPPASEVLEPEAPTSDPYEPEVPPEPR